MSTDLALLEDQLRPMTPHFGEALQGSGLAPEKLIRTILVSMERTPTLLQCTRPSVIQSAMTAAVLGLEADGVLGQFFMVPFKGKAQPIIGYKGFATLAGRSGFTINGGVYREGDEFEYEEGSAGYVRHRRRLGGGRDRRILAAWATASRPAHAPIVSVLDLDDLLFIKGRSPGAKRSESPWNDPEIGFPAMCEKSAKRRLARSLPLNLMVTAAAMEEAHEEQGKHAWLDPKKGLIVDGEAQQVGDRQPESEPLGRIEAPRFVIHKGKRDVACATIEEWRGRMILAMESISPGENLERFWDLNAAEVDRLSDEHPQHAKAVGEAYEKRRR